MTHTISKLLAMAVIAVGAVTALPSVSPAQSLDLYIGPRGDDGDYRDYRRYDDDDDYYYRPRRGCTPARPFAAPMATACAIPRSPA